MQFTILKFEFLSESLPIGFACPLALYLQEQTLKVLVKVLLCRRRLLRGSLLFPKAIVAGEDGD